MDNVLFINSTQQQCGVYQYGVRVFDIIKHSEKYNFVYVEALNNDTYLSNLALFSPKAVIYNYHPLTMPWFTGEKRNGITQYQIHHEGSVHDNLKPDFYLFADSIYPESQNILSLPRPLFENVPKHNKPEIPTIKSFGFGFGNKNYGQIVKLVNEQFDEAVIALHIPRAFFGDKDGQATNDILPGIYSQMKNPNIRLELTHDFMDSAELLRFLSESTLNIFLYEQMNGRGLSSTIDYALSVDVPIAVNHSYMFRHIYSPGICAETRTLQEIIDSGIAPILPYRDKWSNQNLLKKIENIIQ